MKHYEIKSELFKYIENRINELERDGEEYIQEYDNEDEADKCFAKIDELKNLETYFRDKAVELIIDQK